MDTEKIKHDNSLMKFLLKSSEYGEKYNVIIKKVFKHNKSVYVNGYDKNKDRNGCEYGEFTQLYYSFIKGMKRKCYLRDELAKTTDEWVKEMKIIHPEYDYSKTNYMHNHSSVTIICPKHGEFKVQPKAFAKKEYKCAKCKKDEKINLRKIEIHNELKRIHPEYIFDMDSYKNVNTKIKVICPKHGEFWTFPKLLLKNTKCSLCANEENGISRKKPINEYIKEAQKVHGKKYDYSKVEYINSKTKICIICPEHGEFWQEPWTHLRSNGCPKCSNTYVRTKEDFISDAIKIHGNKYDYSKVNYVDTHTKVLIVCHEKDQFGNRHGEFWQTPKLHLRGYGCKKCSNNYLDRDSFILKADLIHSKKYDYSKVEYINNKTKVCIICPKHGEFWQIPNSHLSGQGCPMCKTSKLENDIKKVLNENNIKYTHQKRFKNWLGMQSLDFYIPSKNIAIECQGMQHFKNERRYQKLDEIQERDRKKKKLCKENNVHLIYYVPEIFAEFMEKDDVFFTNTNDIIEYIESYE